MTLIHASMGSSSASASAVRTAVSAAERRSASPWSGGRPRCRAHRQKHDVTVQKPALAPKANSREDHRERGGVVHTGDLARRQRLTDNGGVADGIDLLEQVGNDNGEREHEQRLPARSLREVHGLKERTKRKRRLMIHKPHLLPRCIFDIFHTRL